jgi:phosphoadenosine phosphosulfate reductase
MLAIEKKNFQRFSDANVKHFQFLIKSTNEDKEGYPIGTEPFIEEQVKRYAKREIVVSFSGGKDSVVVSHLVRKALNNQSILHIFGDTTLEQPNTYDFLTEFKKNNPMTPFFEERNDDSNFFEMCEKIGPPSRVKSWCCSVFKTGPMGTTLSAMNMKILTFYGVRRHESVSRSKYERVTQSPKLKQQIVASPVVDWLDIDIWLYMFTEKLPINFAYRQGFSRVGCWCCPNNSELSDKFAKIYYPNEYDKWHDFLVDFAKQIGKPDAEEYIETGKWKARQGGAGLDSTGTKISSKDCVMNDNTAKTYQLTRPIDNDFFELFKPFGKLNDSIGKRKLGELHILNKNDEPIFKLIAKTGETSVRITLLMTDSKELNKQYIKKLGTFFWNYIDNQIRKFQSCIYCKACDCVCPVSAIKIEHNKYTINEKLCTHCLKCINHFASGCLIAAALVTKNEDVIN